jgi:hypothetical protein
VIGATVIVIDVIVCATASSGFFSGVPAIRSAVAAAHGVSVTFVITAIVRATGTLSTLSVIVLMITAVVISALICVMMTA